MSDLPDWSRASEVGLDTEFYDQQLRKLGCGARREGTYIGGVSFMLKGHRPFYLPVAHPEGSLPDPGKVWEYFRDQFAKFRGTVLGANIPIDLDYLDTKHKVKFNYDHVKVYDVQVADALINELQRRYSLEAIGDRRKVKSKDKELLKKAVQDFGYDVSKPGWEVNICRIPAKYAGPYAENDVSCLFPIRDSQAVDIEAQNLHEVLGIEMQITVIALEMRQLGIRVDFDELAKVEELSIRRERELLAEIKDLTGHDVGFDNCSSADAVAPALFARGIELPKTETGQWSITTELLENIPKSEPIGGLIRKLRQANKIRRTFVRSVEKYQTNGRIHGTLRQIVGASEKNERAGAAFGRFSHVHPNTSQDPSRGFWAKPWQKIYIPEDGCEFLSSDFSAQEPRWVVHFSSLLGLTGAEALAEEYRRNPRIDPHGALADVVYGLDNWKKAQRENTKIAFLATIYSQGGAQLCKKQLKLPTRYCVSWTVNRIRHAEYFETFEEAMAFRKNVPAKCSVNEVAGAEGQEILDKINNGAPFLKELVKRVTDKVEKTGTLRILGGRVIHFPLNSRGEYDFAHKGLNRIVQGSSGYQTKLAMIALWKELKNEFKMQRQKHDELIGSISDRRTTIKVREIMRECVKNTRVPFQCEAEVGPNLGELQVVCNDHGCITLATKDKDGKSLWGCETHQ